MPDRTRRINESVREVISEALSDLSDPRIGFVTITTVQVTKDQRLARVFYTVLGDEAARERTLKGLQAAHGVLQRAVARQVKLRETPQLRFEYDDTTDTAIRIGKLLSDAERDSNG